MIFIAAKSHSYYICENTDPPIHEVSFTLKKMHYVGLKTPEERLDYQSYSSSEIVICQNGFLT